MALIIKGTQSTPIKIQGTDFTIPEVYNRLRFYCMEDGINISIDFNYFTDKTKYQEGYPINVTDLPLDGIYTSIDPLTQTQNLEVVHDLAKLYFEQLGYEVTIDLT